MEERLAKDKRRGSRSRQEELSDHNFSLAPVKGVKEGRRIELEDPQTIAQF